MKKIVLLTFFGLFAFQIFGFKITGVVKDVSGNGIENASVFAEWVSGRAVKRKFAKTLKDGSFGWR